MVQRGFTLIEMAIVLTIIGLMIGGGLLAIGPLVDKAKFNQTNTTLDQVENALVLFVIRNNRLPCPALGTTLASDPVNYGIEQPIGGGTCTATAATGVIPWRTLGLDEAYSTDAWNDRLSYYAAQPGQLGTGATAATTTAASIQRNGTTYPTGPFLTVTNATTSQPITPPATSNDQAAYVLVSHGKSGWYSYSKPGTAAAIIHPAAFAGGPKACNSAPGACSIAANSFVSGTGIGAYPPSSNNFFDDMVRWRSPAFLIQLCGSGACGN